MHFQIKGLCRLHQSFKNREQSTNGLQNLTSINGREIKKNLLISNQCQCVAMCELKYHFQLLVLVQSMCSDD